MSGFGPNVAGEGARREMKKDEDVRRDPPFMHRGTAARDNDFFVNYQVAYEAVPGRGQTRVRAPASFCHTPGNFIKSESQFKNKCGFF